MFVLKLTTSFRCFGDDWVSSDGEGQRMTDYVDSCIESIGPIIQIEIFLVIIHLSMTRYDIFKTWNSTSIFF